VKNDLFSKKDLTYLITEGKSTAQNFPKEKLRILNIIKLAINAKIDLIQIREKNIPARLVFDLASDAVKIAQNTPTQILVNDRSDIAIAANADGVHLTSRSIPTFQIRKYFPLPFVVGVSTHTVAEARAAQQAGADFITFSPIFTNASKESYGVPQGLEKLREICEELNGFSVIALGGIKRKNISDVLESGASGIAAIRYLNNEVTLRTLNKVDWSFMKSIVNN
jgi:thiamine-phosphate pyrophosphorylase